MHRPRGKGGGQHGPSCCPWEPPDDQGHGHGHGLRAARTGCSQRTAHADWPGHNRSVRWCSWEACVRSRILRVRCCPQTRLSRRSALSPCTCGPRLPSLKSMNRWREERGQQQGGEKGGRNLSLPVAGLSCVRPESIPPPSNYVRARALGTGRRWSQGRKNAQVSRGPRCPPGAAALRLPCLPVWCAFSPAALAT